MSLSWGREICGNLAIAESREWLCTNGIGGLASGTCESIKIPKRRSPFFSHWLNHLGDYGVGSIAEIFDGSPPFAPRGCIAQAWSVAETLRTWVEIAGGTPVTLPDLA